MKMNDKFRELIAVGASVTANCQPCIKLHVEKALASGASPKEVLDALDVTNCKHLRQELQTSAFLKPH